MPTHLTSTRRALAALAVLVAAAGCDRGDNAGGDAVAVERDEVTTTTPQAGDGETTTTTAVGGDAETGVDIAGQASASGLSAEDVRLVRLDDRQMALQFTLVNDSGDSFAPFGELDGQSMLLVDVPRSTVYGVLDENDRTSDLVVFVENGDTLVVTVVYSAPPDEVDELLVLIDAMVPAIVPIEEVGATLTDDPVLDGEGPAVPFVALMVLPVETGEPGAPATFEIALPGDVLFEFGSADLTPAAQATLSELGATLPASSGTLVIEGHTDGVGDDAANQALSEQRAAAVTAALQSTLGDDFTYQSSGLGETEPVAVETAPDGSDDPDGRARNRRVTVRLESETATSGVLEPRDDLTTQYADLGATIEDVSLRRMGGAALLELTVSTPQNLELLPGDGLIGVNEAPEEITVADSTGNRRHSIGTWQVVSRREFTAGSFSAIYGPAGGTRTIPAGESVTFWALFAEPPAGVASVDVEVPGFGLLSGIAVEG